MNATTRDLPHGADAPVDLDATIAYEPGDSDLNHAHEQPGRDRFDERAPSGSSDMPNPSPQPAPLGQGRYTYGSGARPLDGYTIKRAIGRGGFGEVYYATSDSGKEVAIKLVLRNLDVERRGVVQCMNLKCPNLLTIYDLKSNDAGDTFVIMEYVAGPSLANVLARYPNGMPVAEVRAWLKGLVEGVAYLHDHGIVHRDLKPANLFMEEGLVKIGDYGLAKLITPGQGSEHSESIGTCHYMAPEIASGKYFKPIDIYAIGVIMFEMLTGRVPFDGETVGEVLMKHLTSRADVSPLAEPFRSIVAKALEKDPNKRPKRIQDLLHPEDAPKSPSIRFIGDGKSGPTLPVQDDIRVVGKTDEDVLKIEAEEPVFYIGPDTRPPVPPIAERLRRSFAGLRRPIPVPNARNARPIRQVAAPAQPQQRPQPQAAKPWKLKKRAPEPPPEPPPLPNARQRLAELSASMVKAAPAAALLAILPVVLLGVDVPAHPENYAFLFGMTLLGTWATLVPTMLFEGGKAYPTFRKALGLALGTGVGVAAMGLVSLLDMGPMNSLWRTPAATFIADLGMPVPGWNDVAYFSLLGLIGGWPWMAARDRRRRFGIFPVLKAGAFGGVLGLALPFPQPWGLAIAALTAATVQVVSPWSKPAADYRRYAARAAKRARKVA
jgi:eukaryotic-like serine/threonine-protein kinase